MISPGQKMCSGAEVHHLCLASSNHVATHITEYTTGYTLDECGWQSQTVPSINISPHGRKCLEASTRSASRGLLDRKEMVIGDDRNNNDINKEIW